MTALNAINDLNSYAKSTIAHSKRQYAKHGTLHDVAKGAFSKPDIWAKPWVPMDFDFGLAHKHPLFNRMTKSQQLAWNHLQWGLEYTVVGQGERQIITLNKCAVSQYADILPSVVKLEERECFEEIDHLAAFQEGLDALHGKYFSHRNKPLWSIPASGFPSETLNKIFRKHLGILANHILGANFPTLFFLTRGMKTHHFKPFENAIANHTEAPIGIREVSHLHRLDESRHMATALYIAQLSNQILNKVPNDSRILFELAIRAAWPKDRMWEYRIRYWKSALSSPIFGSISKADKNALLAHIKTHTAASLTKLHPRQERLTRQANKRIVEQSGLSNKMKKHFVEILRQNEQHAPLVEAVQIQT